MSEEATHDTTIFTPCGDDLAMLLNQPEISGAFIRKLLKRRGVIVNSTEKSILNDHLILSFLSPHEVESLLNEIRQKEESLKLRTSIHEVETIDVKLSEIVPRQAILKFNEVCKDPNGNYNIEGNPSFSKIGEDRYLLEYTLVRNRLSADWIKSKSRFRGKIELKKKKDSHQLVIGGYHSSPETKSVNSKFKNALKQDLEKRNLIRKNSESTLSFGDFNNYQRLSFFMRFTESFPSEKFTFSKISDLDFKVDDILVPVSEQRISWMKDQISKSKISGKALQDAFLLKERTCWNYIKVWRVEMRFDVSTVDFDGAFILILEFDNYARQFADSAKFQISIDKILTRRYKGSTRALQSSLLARLNDYAFEKEI